MEQEASLQEHANRIAAEHSHVESVLPILPELTGVLLDDAAAQFALEPSEIARFARDSKLASEDVAQQFLSIAESLGGGLSPEGKRDWIFSRLSDGYTLDEIAAEAEGLKDSPAT